MSDEDYIRRGEFNRMDHRISSLDRRLTRTEVRADHTELKLDKIEANTTWLLRIIISAIVMALLGLVLL